MMPDQKDVEQMGGTMRLGVYPCRVVDGSRAAKAYGQSEVLERHRHRFEFNNAYREPFEAAGMMFSGTSPDGNLVEIVELTEHPFYVASQFHPEFKSKPNKPHPLFSGFIAAAHACDHAKTV